MTQRVTLYIAGDVPNSLRARKAITQLCERVPQAEVELSIIDILAMPEVAYAQQIIAVPVLVRHHPPPVRKLIGDLSDQDRLLRFRDLPQEVERAVALQESTAHE